jgi:muconolactone delta-isomerase
MLVFMQMLWKIEDRLSFDQVWHLELEESVAAQDLFKVVAMYKVAGQKRVLAIVEVDSADQLDRAIMGKLPLREYLEFETIWPVRPFESFLEDCRTAFGSAGTAPATGTPLRPLEAK